LLLLVDLIYVIHFADENKWDWVVFKFDLTILVQALSFRTIGIQNFMLLFLVLFIGYLYIPTSKWILLEDKRTRLLIFYLKRPVL